MPVNDSARVARSAALRHGLNAFLVLVVILMGANAIRHTPPVPRAMNDFGLIHLGGLCFLDRCDPYVDENLLAVSEAHAEAVPHKRERLVYLPSALLMATPLARAGWPAAGVWWDYLSLLTVAVLFVVMVQRIQLERFLPAAVPLVLFAFGTPFMNAIEWGNPALMSAALAALGYVLVMPVDIGGGAASVWGAVLLGLALALKPQMAVGPLVVLLLYRPTRRAAVQAVSVAAAFLLVAVLLYRLRLGSFEFLHSFVLSNEQVAASGGPSDQSANNPASVTFLGLRALGNFLGFVPTWSVVFARSVPVLLALAAKRSGAFKRMPWCMLALAAVLQIFPVYHRPYDRTLVLMLVPAVLEIAALGRRRLGWLFTLTACFWYLFDPILYRVAGRLLKLPLGPMLELALCGILLWAMWGKRKGMTEAMPSF